MRLIVPILLNCFAVVAICLANKYTPFKKLSFVLRQIIIGLLFGGVSAFASSFGVELLGTMVNVRDAAPLSAGLIFGAPAGIIAGFIGGLYRWFSVAWGAGEYTQLACTLATIFAGFMAAGFRKLMFDDKKPTWGYGVSITVVCEVVHMLFIFLTNMRDSAHAFEFVRGASIPMIIGNAVAVGGAIIIVSLLGDESLFNKNRRKQISQTFQRWLLFCFVLAFLVTSTFTYFLQNGMAHIETESIFTTAIDDVTADVRDKSDDYLLAIAERIARKYEYNPNLSLHSLAEENGVIEINIVAEDGLIVRSTDPVLEQKFNMNSTAQSAEFMMLTEGVESYVQEYGPVGSDGVTMRKFAGVALEKGGYIQVGYSSKQFHDTLDGFVTDVTKNRRVGSNGFVAICNESFNLVTQNDRNGEHISSIGIVPDTKMLNGETHDKLQKATVVNYANGYSEKYIYTYTFVEGYCIIAAMPEAEAMSMRDVSIYNSVFMQVLIFATLFIFIYILIKQVIINNMKKVNHGLAQITDGNLDVTVDVRSNEEFASLSDDINSTVTTLKEYIAEAAARIDKELEYAKQIQLSALPTNFPDNEAYSIYAEMIAAKEVGGDFYDFYELGESTVAFLVADVSGKGIPAAMFMMRAKTIIKDLAESGMSVEEIFNRANEKLCESNESGMFVTAWMGILDYKTGKMQYANAGHNPPLIKRKGGGFEYLRTKGSMVLAGLEGVRYRVNETELKNGDRLFLYTDGVTEATNSEEKLFGEARLLEYMNQHGAQCATALLPGLKENIDVFVGEAPQFDDITILMLDFKAEDTEITAIEKQFPAQTEALDSVLGFVEETLESHQCPMKIQTAICVAMEEVFVNVARYAYKGEVGKVSLTISFDHNSRTVGFRMADRGVPFNPLERPDPDISLSAELREIGGLGIFITKKTMDTVSYAYSNGENVLTMTKKI